MTSPLFIPQSDHTSNLFLLTNDFVSCLKNINNDQIDLNTKNVIIQWIRENWKSFDTLFDFF